MQTHSPCFHLSYLIIYNRVVGHQVTDCVNWQLHTVALNASVASLKYASHPPYPILLLMVNKIWISHQTKWADENEDKWCEILTFNLVPRWDNQLRTILWYIGECTVDISRFVESAAKLAVCGLSYVEPTYKNWYTETPIECITRNLICIRYIDVPSYRGLEMTWRNRNFHIRSLPKFWKKFIISRFYRWYVILEFRYNGVQRCLGVEI